MGARAVRKMIDERPDADLEVLVVWTPMLAGDDIEHGRMAAKVFEGTAVKQFWDGDRSLAARVARSIPIEPSLHAWDVYLFYDSNVGFGDPSPAPLDWVHQLARAAPERYCGGRIESALRERVERLFPTEVHR